MENIIHGDCLEKATIFPEESINLIVTSPPYAQQRKKQYGGISEKAYPVWTVNWFNAFHHALKEDGSIAIVVRANIHQGQISDYVLRTRLLLRDSGWNEAEELIWIKPDSPPLGHTGRPRRAWENILWFSKSNRPFCDPKANGKPSDRIGFESIKGVGDYKQGVSSAKKGVARCRDYVEVGTGATDKSPQNTHPAQFPETLASWLIRLLCPKDGFVVDPFVGSGTSLVACQHLNSQGYNLKYCGIDSCEEYCQISKNRLFVGN